ncbi:hypothetical protein FRB95_011209 [Tulasnella sp. JGI-2019a]|nr:hypothetical protein FRB95_011209 [Tulasnella sp. JGI-2019a]
MQSVSTDKSLAIALPQSGVVQLFQTITPKLSKKLAEISDRPSAVDGQDAISAALFVGLLYVETRVIAIAEGSSMSESERKALAKYMQEVMPKLKFVRSESTRYVEALALRSLSLVEQVFKSTPTVAFASGLEEACKWLPRELKERCAGVGVGRGRADCYALIKCILRYDAEAGWWKLGGLKRACILSYPEML